MSSARPGDLEEAQRRRRSRALAGIVVVTVLAALLEVVPLGFALFGAVLLVAWARGAWDPTWNDGDGWLAAAAVVVVVLIAVGAAAAVLVLARAGRLPPVRAVVITVGCSIAAALVPVVLVATR